MSFLQSVISSIAAGVILTVLVNLVSSYAARVKSNLQHEENRAKLTENTNITKEILTDVKRINGMVQRHAQRLDDHHEEINRLRDQARRQNPGRG